MTENEISYAVRGSVFDVYNHFGPGLFESVYKQALFVTLQQKGVEAKKEVAVPVTYLDYDLGPTLEWICLLKTN